MTSIELTRRARGETVGSMVGRSRANGWVGRRTLAPVVIMGAVVLGGAMLSGCVSVNAPDKPIVIELNINIKQEVIYRLASDAGNTIEKNPGVF